MTKNVYKVRRKPNNYNNNNFQKINNNKFQKLKINEFQITSDNLRYFNFPVFEF